MCFLCVLCVLLHTDAYSGVATTYTSLPTAAPTNSDSGFTLSTGSIAGVYESGLQQSLMSTFLSFILTYLSLFLAQKSFIVLISLVFTSHVFPPFYDIT